MTLATAFATVPSFFSDVQVAAGLTNPTAMTLAPDGRIFVCEQGGKLRIIKGGSLLSTAFLTLSVNTSGERGLLGVALDPNFSSNHYVYVYYTNTSGPHNRVSRFTASGDVAVSGSEKVLFDLPTLNAIFHNGGAIHFGPDGKLYIAVGDNKTGQPAQSKSALWGKLLRINSDGTIPSDNPFYASTTGSYRAIWAYGLRNPFTFAFQPGTSRVFINDVGEASWEEINDGTKGSNYGWPNAEGNSSNSAYKNPFYTYSRTAPSCAIIGGSFYDPVTPKFPPGYIGDYFFGDYCSGTIRSINLSDKKVSGFASGISSLVDIKVGDDGNLYYLSRGNGSVRKISYTNSQAPSISQQPASKTVSVGGSATFAVAANGATPFTYQWQRNQSNISGATSASYTRSNIQSGDNGSKYRCIVSNTYGTATSSEAVLTVTTDQPPTAAITTPVSGTTYSAGQTINYAGTGTDPEDGTLPAANFTWQVDFHHDTHIHPFIAAFSGVKSGSFVIPQDNEVASTVWYRIILTVKDSKGLTDTVYRDIQPNKVTLTLATSPSGLSLNLDGQPRVTPFTFVSVVGIHHDLDAPSPQSLSGSSYVYSSWSDAGAQAHQITAPSAAKTYTATFKAAAGTIYEAEKAAISGAVVATAQAGYTGTGYVDYINASGDYVEWTVNAASAGVHPIDFRFANGGSTGRPLKIAVNGTTVSTSFSFPSTGSWLTWSTVTLNASLNAGSNKIRATAIGASGPNMDHLNLR